MRTKPILLISPLPPPHGGIATWTKTILNYGMPDGSPITLVDTRIRGERNIFDKASFTFAEIVRTVKVFSALIYQLITNRPRVMHLSCSLSPVGIFRDMSCARLAKLFRVPVISHYHGNVPDFRGQRFHGGSEWGLRALMQIAKINIVENQPSLAAATQLIKKHDANTLVLLPNFIEDELFTRVARTREAAPKRMRAIFAGGITRAKGCGELLETAKQLPDIDFHLFGKIHADMHQACQQAPSNLILHGAVNHEVLLKEMHESDFLLFPSYTEGFPLTVLEAMSLGLPVIASNVGALPEMIDQGKGGFLVAPRDVPSLVNAIQTLTADTTLLSAMGHYNKQKSFNHYRYSIVMATLVNLYNQLSG